MDKRRLREEARRLDFLIHSFLDGHDGWTEISEENARDIVAILARDLQLALHGVDLDRELAERREKSRREHELKGDPIQQLNRLLESVACEWHGGVDIISDEDARKDRRDIDAVLIVARRAEDVTSLVADFFVARGKPKASAYRALASLYPGDPETREDTLKTRNKPSRKRSRDKSSNRVPRRKEGG